MRILNVGESCPCCGQPIPEGLSEKAMLLLSYVAAGVALDEALKNWEEEDHAKQNDLNGTSCV